MAKIFLYILIVIAVTLGYIWINNPEQENGRQANLEQNEQVSPEQDESVMESSEHLKFKGVPIDGTLRTFVARMTRKGFKYEGDTRDGASVLKGDFAAYKECKIYVCTLDNKDLVARISVTFPPQDQWKHLYGDYKNLKALLTEKYGKPASCTEKFQEAYIYTSDDSFRMSGVKSDKCKYITCFNVKNGQILLSIEHQGYSSCFVMLTYSDKANSNTIKQHAIDDL